MKSNGTIADCQLPIADWKNRAGRIPEFQIGNRQLAMSAIGISPNLGYTAATMSAKHKIRELAMLLLFVWDANGASDIEAAPQVLQQRGDDGEIKQKAITLAQAVWEARPLADACIERLAPQWPIRRLAAVDRAVLRIGIWELTSSDTPPKVAIDEAIELAKEYSTELSAGFVNGVMDAALREKQTLTAMPAAAPATPPSETPPVPTPPPPTETTPQ